MLDSFLDWSVIVLPTVVSIVGVYVAIELPTAQHKSRWKIGLLIFGLLVSGITLWQQHRTRVAQSKQEEAHATEQHEFQHKLDQERKDLTTQLNESRLAQEYMKGQLSGLSLMVGKINDNGSNKHLAQALERISHVTEQGQLTNKQLCRRAAAVAKQMQEFEYQAKTADASEREQEDQERRAAGSDRDKIHAVWDKYVRIYEQRSSAEELEFRRDLLPEALFVKTELLKRIADPPKVPNSATIIFEGRIAGPSPISDGADYLLLLAKTLCP